VVEYYSADAKNNGSWASGGLVVLSMHSVVPGDVRPRLLGVAANCQDLQKTSLA